MHSKFMLMFRQLVYRTMEQATHKGVEKMAGVYAHGLIKQTWAGLVSKIAASSPK